MYSTRPRLLSQRLFLRREVSRFVSFELLLPISYYRFPIELGSSLLSREDWCYTTCHVVLLLLGRYQLLSLSPVDKFQSERELDLLILSSIGEFMVAIILQMVQSYILRFNYAIIGLEHYSLALW